MHQTSYIDPYLYSQNTTQYVLDFEFWYGFKELGEGNNLVSFMLVQLCEQEDCQTQKEYIRFQKPTNYLDKNKKAIYCKYGGELLGMNLKHC